MSDDNSGLEETLRRHQPRSPSVQLRARILEQARDVRRRVRRRWCAGASFAAAFFVMVVVGYSVERREMSTCERLLATGLASRAEAETRELTVALADLLDGGTPPGEIERSLRMRMAPRPSPVGPAAWQQAHQEPTF